MVVPRYFCCCLPVRLGVFLLSCLSLSTGGISATAVWYAYARIQQVDPTLLTTIQNIAFILSGVMYTLLPTAAIVGLTGAAGRKLLLVEIYSKFTAVHLVTQVAVTSLAIYASFRHSDELLNACREVDYINNMGRNVSDTSVDVIDSDRCQSLTSLGRINLVISLFFFLALELYLDRIVKSYRAELADEQDQKNIRVHVPYLHGNTYQGYSNHTYPLFQPQYGRSA